MTDSTLAVREPVRTLAPLGGTSPLSRDQIELLKRTVAKGVTDDELSLFVHVANRSGLDPFAKQIHAVKRRDNRANRDVMTIQTGIDGFRLIAARTSQHAGTDEAVFVEENGKPTKASVTVYKMVAGARVPFAASARWSEYAQTYKDGNPMGLWGKMPFTMLAKCAEALALRKAFPMDLSGVYAHEEMTQAGGPQTFDEPTSAPEADSSQPEASGSDDVRFDDLPPVKPGENVGKAVSAADVVASVKSMLREDKALGTKTLGEARTKAGVTAPNASSFTDADWLAVNAHLPAPWRVTF